MVGKTALIILAWVSSPALAADPTDQPHRPWGKTIHVNMSFQEAQACVARWADTQGTVLVIPRPEGADIDMTMSVSFLNPHGGEPQFTFQLRGIEKPTLTALYRHPFSAKNVDTLVKKMRKRCLIVRED
jgi:hypothetical protein